MFLFCFVLDSSCFFALTPVQLYVRVRFVLDGIVSLWRYINAKSCLALNRRLSSRLVVSQTVASSGLDHGQVWSRDRFFDLSDDTIYWKAGHWLVPGLSLPPSVLPVCLFVLCGVGLSKWALALWLGHRGPSLIFPSDCQNNTTVMFSYEEEGHRQGQGHLQICLSLSFILQYLSLSLSLR